ncbi:RNA polymerase factor sigma-54 [Pseudobacteroides cellulosolvens]|uniref:RNA polymerase, sigma 54 subunit, RpoN n=1 Tax=Pseudobacteroides cellulosolvens ATCC 35603 = DSM 2933 TaxID=398512 RepID=A0A0L6JQS7_9FIRM|nr:RNA polymerase factor sigma-54 [Pseudobacteroides cellulosolvens]KNY28055.1 RNA polymerase, sigma 54 subunit, RpoN [Pseudobacteroides cellulosolvens ATCC 35603 = DSM 2933]
MNTRLGTQISQNQQLTITPKIIYELKVLQMSNIELMQYITIQLDENPLLDMEDYESTDFELQRDETAEDNMYEKGYVDLERKFFSDYVSNHLTLRDHLQTQIRELCIDAQIRKIAFYLIETINDYGYLSVNINEVSCILGVALNKVKKALSVIQKLDPAGIGARNLKECILLQLNRRRELDENIKTVVINYLELLAEKKYKSISEKLDLPYEQVVEIYKKIKNIDPKPGLKFSGNYNTMYIQPDLITKFVNDKFIVLFINDGAMSLKINEHYRSLIKNEQSSIETKKYIKSNISKAIDVIKAIELRKRTILNVANCIIEYQNDFLKNGHKFLRPLSLKMVADKVGLHESTISRTVNGKYIETPRGIYELKYFFSTEIDTVNDSGIAANAVKKAIRNIVQNEDIRNPLSDEQIRRKIGVEGINVARRTIAKYREEMSILPAKLRRLY